MSKYVCDTGAFYAYIQKGLGKAVGTGGARCWRCPPTWQRCWRWRPTTSVILSSLLEIVGGPAVPWWVLTGVVLLVIAFLGYRDIDLSAEGAGHLPGVGGRHPGGARPRHRGAGRRQGITGDSFTPSGISGRVRYRAALRAVWGFVGVEATAVFRDEAKIPTAPFPAPPTGPSASLPASMRSPAGHWSRATAATSAIQVAKDDPDNFMVNTRREVPRHPGQGPHHPVLVRQCVRLCAGLPQHLRAVHVRARPRQCAAEEARRSSPRNWVPPRTRRF